MTKNKANEPEISWADKFVAEHKQRLIDDPDAFGSNGEDFGIKLTMWDPKQ